MSLTDRTASGALIPEPVAKKIIQGMIPNSIAMSSFTRQEMSVKQERTPVLDTMPVANFVNGDTGYRKHTAMAWDNVYLIAEVLNCLIPIPKTVLADSQVPMWDQIRPRMEAALSRAFDDACFFGTNKPASWPDDLTTAVKAKGLTVTMDTAGASEGGIAEDMNELLNKLEQLGYEPSTWATYKGFRHYLRAARDTTGQKLADVSTDTAMGLPILYGMPGLFPKTTGNPELFGYDASNFVYGVREDVTYEVWDQAVIQDPDTKEIIYNLPQQGMVALSVDIRCAYAVANPVTYEESDRANLYPAIALVMK